MNPRAVIYRRLHDIDASFGTAVNIQAMVLETLEKRVELALPLPAILPPVKRRCSGNFY